MARWPTQARAVRSDRFDFEMPTLFAKGDLSDPPTLSGALRWLDEFPSGDGHVFDAVLWLSDSNRRAKLSWGEHIAPRFRAFKAALLYCYREQEFPLNGRNEWAADILKAKAPLVKRVALAVDVLDLLERLGPAAENCSCANAALKELVASTTPSARRWERVRRAVVGRGIVEFWRAQTAHLYADDGIGRKRDRKAFETDFA